MNSACGETHETAPARGSGWASTRTSAALPTAKSPRSRSETYTLIQNLFVSAILKTAPPAGDDLPGLDVLLRDDPRERSDHGAVPDLPVEERDRGAHRFLARVERRPLRLRRFELALGHAVFRRGVVVLLLGRRALPRRARRSAGSSSRCSRDYPPPAAPSRRRASGSPVSRRRSRGAAAAGARASRRR